MSPSIVNHNRNRVMTDSEREFILAHHSKISYDKISKELKVGYPRLFKWLDELNIKKWKTKPDYKHSSYNYTPVDLEFLLLLVSKHTNATVDQIRSESRKAEAVRARQLYCLMAFSYTRNSGKSIAKHIGDRDHTTVSSAIKTISDLLDTGYEDVKEIVEKVESEVSSQYKKVNRKIKRGQYKKAA